MTTTRRTHTRTSTWAMPRRRGSTTGTLLILLGIWGAIIPFIGPLFDYAADDAGAWTFTWDRLWLSILPGAAAFVGGLALTGAANRLSATFGAWLATAGGIWFVVGPSVALLWGSELATAGIGTGSDTQRFIEQIGYFYGLGVLIAALAAGAWGRLLVRSERDTALLESGSVDSTATAVPATGAERYPDAERYPAESGTERGPMDPPGRAAGTSGSTDPMASRSATPSEDPYREGAVRPRRTEPDQDYIERGDQPPPDIPEERRR